MSLGLNVSPSTVLCEKERLCHNSKHINKTLTQANSVVLGLRMFHTGHESVLTMVMNLFLHTSHESVSTMVNIKKIKTSCKHLVSDKLSSLGSVESHSQWGLGSL